MRLIDADRLLSDRVKSKYYHLPNGDTAIPIIDIEHAPTVNQWIPCSERLPDEECEVLTTIKSNMFDADFIEVLEYGRPLMPNRDAHNKPCFYWIDSEWGDVVEDDVIAWLPLPEPYKGGESNVDEP